MISLKWVGLRMEVVVRGQCDVEGVYMAWGRRDGSHKVVTLTFTGLKLYKSAAETTRNDNAVSSKGSFNLWHLC